MKKVAIVAHEDLFVEHFLLPYVKMYKDNGYEVHIITNGNNDFKNCDKKIKVPMVRNPYNIKNIKAYFQLKKNFNTEKYDVVNSHTPIGGVLARLAAKKIKKNGSKIIYTVHGFHFFKGAPTYNNIFYFAVEKILSKYTNDIVTMNKEDYNLAKEKFKTNVHHSFGIGINSSNFDAEISNKDKNDLRKKLGLKTTDIILVYVAELSIRKNQGMLLQVIKKLNEENNKYKLLLIGEDSLNGYYQKLSLELGIQNNVIFLGYKKNINKYLKISNIFVSTSTQEGLPMCILEAMASKLPVVATNCRGNRDLLNKKHSLVKLGAVEDMVIKIKNNTYCQKLNKNYCIENVMKKLEKIYLK